MSVSVGEHRETQEPEIDPDQLVQVIESVYRALELPAGDIEISLVDDELITELNMRYRDKPVPTNVLSFPHYEWARPCVDSANQIHPDGPPVLWGEIVVSVQTVRRDAERMNVPFLQELIRICIHGMLHLFGFDHEREGDYEIMNRAEESAMAIVYRRMKQPG